MKIEPHRLALRIFSILFALCFYLRQQWLNIAIVLMVHSFMDYMMILVIVRDKLSDELFDCVGYFGNDKKFYVRLSMNTYDETVYKFLITRMDVRGWYNDGPHGRADGKKIVEMCLDCRISYIDIDHIM